MIDSELDYDNPPNFEVFHECSEQKQWELYRKMRELYEQEKESNANNCLCYTQQVKDLQDEIAGLRHELKYRTPRGETWNDR